jgi:exopolysaccharide biosynthesis polyprenyl glycosylphosphotransferase
MSKRREARLLLRDRSVDGLNGFEARGRADHRPAPTQLVDPIVFSPDDHRRRRAAARAFVHSIDGVILLLGVIAAWSVDSSTGWVSVLLAAVIAIALAVGAEEIPSRLTLSALDEVPRILSCAGVSLLVVAPVGLVTSTEGGLLLQAAATAVGLAVGRGWSYEVIRWARRRGMLLDRAAVVGAGEVGREVARILGDHPEFGVHVVGFIDRAPLHGGPALLGDVMEVEAILRRDAITRVIVAFGLRREPELVEVLRRLALLDAEVHVVPRFFDIGVAPVGPRVDDLWGIPLYHAPRGGRHRRSGSVKRLLDVLIAGTCLLLALPVLAVLAIAVRLSGPGGAIFRQPRTGQDGREFRLLKLRSLQARSEADELDPPPDEMNGHHLYVQAARRRDVDRRRTRVGEFARRTCLDELPQLWNVLMGDMSLVGPRPEEAHYARQFSESVPGYRDRHRMPVGLTGWAQVNGLRGQTSIAERTRFDNHYIEHWTFWRDVVILLRTAGAVSRSVTGRFDGHPALDLDGAWKDGR